MKVNMDGYDAGVIVIIICGTAYEIAKLFA